MKQTTFKTYKSCSDIPIYNFVVCLHKSDYSQLIVGKEKFSDSKIENFVSKNKGDLINLFSKLELEYKSITFDKKELNRQKELSAMMFIETKHNAIVKVINLYLECKQVAVLDILNELDIPFDKSKPINKQIEKANHTAMGLRNALNIKTLNFKKKYKISEDDLNKEKEDVSGDIEKSLDAQALVLENNLETGYKIDIKKTNVLRWVNLLETNRIKLEKHNSE